MALTEAAREARRAYKRDWYKANKDKQREYTKRHWEKLAAAAQTALDTEAEPAERKEKVAQGA